MYVYRTMVSRAREREAGREEVAEQRDREGQSRHRGSRPGPPHTDTDARGPPVCASPLDGRGSPTRSPSRSKSAEAGTRSPPSQPREREEATAPARELAPLPEPQGRHEADALGRAEARPPARELVVSPPPQGRRETEAPRRERGASPQAQTQRADGEGSELDWTGLRERSVSEEPLAQRWLGGAPKEDEDPKDREGQPGPAEGEGPAAERPAPRKPPRRGAKKEAKSERPAPAEPPSGGPVRGGAVRTVKLEEEEAQEPPRRRRRGVV